MGKNDKVGSLKVPNKVKAILEQYESSDRKREDLVFSNLERVDDFSNKYALQKAISYENSKLNKRLKKIALIMGLEKKLTMHIARHTFGNISGEKIPIQMLQKLYRHTSITTTIGYQSNFMYKDADDALDSVIDF